MSSAYAVARFLALNSIGTMGGKSKWCLNVGKEPPQPEECVTIYDTNSDAADNDGIAWPSIQVRTRSKDYRSSIERHGLIRRTLVVNPFVFEDVVYSVSHASGPMAIGTDESNRFIIVTNYSLIRDSGE